MELIRQVKVSLLAIDESHCISQVPHDLVLAEIVFSKHTSGVAPLGLMQVLALWWKPKLTFAKYLKIARFAEEMDVERVLCLTATATPEVVEDICDNFLIKRNCVFKTPMYRAK